MSGGGAAGGLAGGLAAAGARLVPGFDLVADEVELYERLEGADLVVTAEGFLDAQSFEGKVVGGVAELTAQAGVPDWLGAAAPVAHVAWGEGHVVHSDADSTVVWFERQGYRRLSTALVLDRELLRPAGSGSAGAGAAL